MVKRSSKGRIYGIKKYLSARLRCMSIRLSNPRIEVTIKTDDQRTNKIIIALIKVIPLSFEGFDNLQKIKTTRAKINRTYFIIRGIPNLTSFHPSQFPRFSAKNE